MANAYAFNPDRSKAPVYTKQEIDQALAQEVADRQAGDSALSGRIDNLVAHAGDGTIPSELVDLRTAFDGKTYASAHSAVDTINRELLNIIKTNNTSGNLFDGLYGKGVLYDGVVSTSADGVYSINPISVVAGEKYELSNYPQNFARLWIACFNNDTFVQNNSTISEPYIFTAPSNVNKIIVFVTFPSGVTITDPSLFKAFKIVKYVKEKPIIYSSIPLSYLSYKTRKPIDIARLFTYEQGRITTDGSEYDPINVSIRSVEYLEIDTPCVVISSQSQGSNYEVRIIYYDSDLNYVSYRMGFDPIEIPSNVKYIRLSINSADWSTQIGPSDSEDVSVSVSVDDKIYQNLNYIANMPSGNLMYQECNVSKSYNTTGQWQYTNLKKMSAVKNSDYTFMWGHCTGFPLPDATMLQVLEQDSNSSTLARHIINSSNYNDHVLQFKTIDSDNLAYISVLIYPVENAFPSSAGIAKVDSLALYSGYVKLNGKLLPQDEIQEIIRNSPVIIPSYFESHLNSKLDEIKLHDDVVGKNGDRFVFITDYHDRHYQTGSSPVLIESIQEAVPINMVVSGGDQINAANVESNMKKYFAAFRKTWSKVSGFYPIIGNHEFYSDWDNEGEYKGGITVNEIYSLINKQLEPVIDGGTGDGAYYVDNKISKFRYYFIPCDYYCNIPSSVSKWILESLQDVPEDYIVVVFSHVLIQSDYSFFYSFENIKLGIEAFNAHTSAVIDGVSYDYSGKSNTVCPLVMAGHLHIDLSTTVNNVNYVVTTTDNYLAGNAEGATRTKGTYDEVAFDVVDIDRVNKTIYCTRIGSGADRVFTWQ